MNRQTAGGLGVNLLYRHRESTFRRYEPALAKVVSSLPQVTLLNPKDFDLPTNTSSCAIYLRATSKSLFENRWATSINLQIFDAHYPLLFCERPSSSFILCGTREAVRVYDKEGIGAVKARNQVPDEQKHTIFTHLVDLTTLTTLINLATSGSISKPIKFETILDEATITSLEEQNNVAIVKQEDNWYLLLV